MALATDIRGDFKAVVDNLEAITLKRPGSSTTVSISQAKRSALSTKEAANSNGKYLQTDVVWRFDVTDGTPHAGDQIVYGSGSSAEIFTILDYTKGGLGNRWRCVCRDLVVAWGLNELLTIKETKTTRGAGGAAEYQDTEDARTGFRGRIQVEGSTPETIEGRRSSRIRARFFMYEPFELDGRHLVVQDDGTEWSVVDYLAAEEIGRLPEAVLERFA